MIRVLPRRLLVFFFLFPTIILPAIYSVAFDNSVHFVTSMYFNLLPYFLPELILCYFRRYREHRVFYDIQYEYIYDPYLARTQPNVRLESPPCLSFFMGTRTLHPMRLNPMVSSLRPRTSLNQSVDLLPLK